jgi:NACalpha-BTF3-like transcription factor
MAMSYVSPKDIDLVVDQVSDCCRGRAFMAMLDTGGDIVDSIMDLVDI